MHQRGSDRQVVTLSLLHKRITETLNLMTRYYHILHYSILSVILILYLIRAVLWTTPNNELHELGISFANSFDMTLGAFAVLCLTSVSLILRKQAPSKRVFFTIQLLGWTYSVGVWVLFFTVALYGTMNAII